MWPWKKRAFDSSIQESRRPVQDPDRFNQLQTEFMKYYGQLLSAAVGSSTMSLSRHAEEAEKALRIADELVDMEPSRAVPWTFRCLALGALLRYSEALVANDQAIAIDPSDPNKWDLRGSILTALGRKNETDKAANQARTLRKG